MKILLTGGCKNGKSGLAQNIAETLSRGRRKYYLATMIPHDDEDEERIRRHIADRAGQHFVTVECGKSFLEESTAVSKDSVFLLDSITALLANNMFLPDGAVDEHAAWNISRDMEIFCDRSGDGIFVSDTICKDGKIYDAYTELYRNGLAAVEQSLAALCDCVIELCAGVPVFHKGAHFAHQLFDESLCNGEKNMHLIIGGAYQGKTAFAKRQFHLEDNEIEICTRDRMPDCKKRCIVHLENYVYYCLTCGKHIDNAFPKNAVLVCDDIFCGVVPMDRTERLWREKTGRLLQKIAEHAHVTRVCCGIGEQLS